MSDMKCPFCGRELSEYDHFDRLLVCFNPQCEAVFTKKDFLGNKNLWQELIRTRKELEQSEICCTEWEKQALDYKAENIALSGDLERTRKALDATLDKLKRIRKIYTNAPFNAPINYANVCTDMYDVATEQITAILENKNGDC